MAILIKRLIRTFAKTIYAKNISYDSYLFDTVLLRIQADSYKHIH